MTRSPGRPRVCDTEDVRRVMRDLCQEGVTELALSEFVAEIMRRVPCSRRTAYRAINRACEEGKLSIQEFGVTLWVAA